MGKVLQGVAVAAAVFFTAGVGIFLAPAVFATTAAITAVNALAIGAVLSGVAKQLAGKPPRPSTSVEYSGTVEPRRIIYGTNLCGGMHCIPPFTTGTNNKYLHQLLAVAGHEVNAMTAVYFNQVALGTISSVTGASGDGLVTTGAYANKAWVRRYLGTATQAADYILDTALTLWTSSHQGRGVAYIAAQFEYDEKVFKEGKPEITALVQGMKVYDPRLDSTNGGAGAHRYATPSTWAYSANPALCLANYLIDTSFGMGEDPATRIDWAKVAVAADECDELVACPVATTQKRYTCNAVLYTSQSFEDNIETIVGSMMGTCLYSGGKWHMTAGSWSAAAFTLGDSNILSADITTALPYKDRYNGIRGTFVDPTNEYQANEFPATQSAAYVTADGESVFKDTQFDACTNVYEAQRAAILLVRKSRNKQSAVLQCDLSAWKIRPGETGIVTCAELSWSNKTVRCESWKFSPEGTIELTVREELSSDWNDPIEADYTSPLTITTPTPVYYTPDAPTSLTSQSTANLIVMSWVAPAVVPVGAVYELWEYTSNSPFSSATLVWTGITLTATLPKTDTTTRYYWVLVRMPDGTAGPQAPSGNGVSGVAGGGVTMATTGYADTGDINEAFTTTEADVTGSSFSINSTVGATTYPLLITWTFDVAAIIAVSETRTMTMYLYVGGTAVKTLTFTYSATGIWRYPRSEVVKVTPASGANTVKMRVKISSAPNGANDVEVLRSSIIAISTDS